MPPQAAGKPPLRVVEDETVVLATEVKRISDAAEKMLRGGLSRKALVLLIHDATRPKVPQRQIEAVLEALPTLKARYTR